MVYFSRHQIIKRPCIIWSSLEKQRQNQEDTYNKKGLLDRLTRSQRLKTFTMTIHGLESLGFWKLLNPRSWKPQARRRAVSIPSPRRKA
jgi:hypothetical protein